MSYSYTNVRTDEYHRLQQEARDAQRLQQEADAIRNRAARRERQINQRHQEDLNSLTARIRAASEQASAEVRQVSNDFRNRLAEQSAQYARERAQQQAQQQRDIQGVNNRITSEVNQVNNRITREINQVNTNVRTLDSKVNEMAEDFNARFNALSSVLAGKQDRARQNIAFLEDILATIRGLRPEKFTPGQLAELERLRSDALNNIQNGDNEAAIATSELGVREAGRLASRLTFLNSAFDVRLLEVRAQGNLIQTQLESFATSAGNTISFTVDGQEYHFDYDINHWAGGRFAQIQAQYEALAQQLEQAPTSDLSPEGLEQLYYELLRLEEAIAACDAFGRDELIRSAVVEDMGIRIHNVLAEQGWTPQETRHTEGDERKPYEMIYSDGSGNEVAIVVSGGDNPQAPNYAVNVYSENEFVEQNLFGWLSEGLRSQGVDVPQPEQCGACATNPNAASFVQNVAQQAVQAGEQAVEQRGNTTASNTTA